MEMKLTASRILKQSEWECWLTPDTVYRPCEHAVPNWFHRKMQELCFGFKWRKKGD